MPLNLTDTQSRQLLDRYDSLPVSLLLRHAILQRIKSGGEVFEGIQGRDQVKQDVMRALLSGAPPYLVSEEGTGKTRLARSISRLLGPVPRIKGCPYNDDPKWPKDRLCPRCANTADPVKDFGVEWVAGHERFSRIQGNEYTNEAKLLGLKDIQTIAQGMSTKDPLAFAGTGVFRANRGILFVDELPAIRTKVQVLLHPIIEEGKAILEEYNWQYPLDLVVIATGNPEGFSHVNEVPRPLTDRLETIYMDLPEEDAELSIMMTERFGAKNGVKHEETIPAELPTFEDAKRRVLAPWWIPSLLNKSVRQSRTCRWLDRRASIRGTTRAIDHTYSSTEMEGRTVTNLKDVSDGLKLALRGRVQLRQDRIDYDNPRETLRKVDDLSEDLLRNGLTDLSNEITADWEREEFEKRFDSMVESPRKNWPGVIMDSSRLREKLEEIERIGREKLRLERFVGEDEDLLRSAERSQAIQAEYLIVAAEFLLAVAAIKKWIKIPEGVDLFVPKEISWSQKGLWR